MNNLGGHILKGLFEIFGGYAKISMCVKLADQSKINIQCLAQQSTFSSTFNV